MDRNGRSNSPSREVRAGVVPEDPGSLDIQRYYEAEERQGFRSHVNDTSRFKACLKLLGGDWRSILDAGCGEGYWLDYVRRHREVDQCVGVELAENRAEKTRSEFPDLQIVTGDISRLPFDDKTFDLVTCMEVLEHLPQWQSAVGELIRIARKAVLITVPFREKIPYQICIHCHRPTPRAGHLHSFDKNSFSELVGEYDVAFASIPAGSPSRLRRLFHRIFRDRCYLAATIRL